MKTRGLDHKYLFFKITVKKRVLDVYLVEMLPPCCCDCHHHTNHCHLLYWGEGLILIESVGLRISLGHQSSLVPVERTANVVLGVVHPFVAIKIYPLGV